MLSKTNGIFIDVERHRQALLIRLKAIGKLTRSDYQKVEPMLEAALFSLHSSNVSAVFDLSEYSSTDLRSSWSDLLTSLKLSSEFRRIALYGHHSWHFVAAKVAGWLFDTEIKAFREYDQAVDWSLAH